MGRQHGQSSALEKGCIVYIQSKRAPPYGSERLTWSGGSGIVRTLEDRMKKLYDITDGPIPNEENNVRIELLYRGEGGRIRNPYLLRLVNIVNKNIISMSLGTYRTVEIALEAATEWCLSRNCKPTVYPI